MPLRLWLLVLTSQITAEAFLPLNSQVRRRYTSGFLKRRFPRPLFMGNPTSANSATHANWRTFTLPEEGEEYETIADLKERAQWSQKQYEEALKIYDEFTSCTDSYVAPGIKDALNCLDHAYRLYGPESVICSFNGGKDAVVIFQLMRAAHANYYRQVIEQKSNNETTSIVRPRALYFEHKDEFPEVLSYLKDSVRDYDLDMIAFAQGIKFNQGLEVLVRNNIPSESSVPYPMAFVLGTRAGDPNAGDQGHFAPSSHYMPPFMRVNPIIQWTYGTVWHFLRVFSLPYCELYDQGYTSLGTTKDTLPCPALAVPGSSGSLPKFWPAYMLQDWSQERAGRIKKEKKENKQASEKAETSPTPPTSAPPSVQESVITSVSALKNADPDVVHLDSEEQAPNDATMPKPEMDLVDDSHSCYSYASDHSDTQRTAGLLVIGDEILKGSTADVNTQVAAKAFREKSVLLKRVVVVSDNLDDIVNEILTMQHEVDVIVTSGGIGPTHDDITLKSVASALGRDMELHEGMAKLLKEKMSKDSDSLSAEWSDLTDAQRKMATLPSRSRLRYLSEGEDEWPVLQCRNVFVLPGVPDYFATKIEAVADYISSDAMERSAVYKVVLSVDEGAIVSVLNAAVEEHPNVSFGSYPFVSHPEFKTVLTLEGRLRKQEETADQHKRESFTKVEMDHHVRLALDYLLTNLPQGSILRVENDDDLL